MLNKAWDCIKVNKMIEKGDRIVVGVSGGADSVCLLYVLEQFCRECGAYLVAVHVNHGIRGEEAARDEQYVKTLCTSWNIDYCSFSADVKGIAKKLGLSEEEAGRKVRYDTFLEICENRKCNKIAIAHNRNDNAETVLFHLFRGTGIKGLSGIAPKRILKTEYGEITIIRPLLGVERKEIEHFLGSKQISWQTDSTNLTEDYSRNKIRNKVLTYATEEINTGAVGNIADAAVQLREAEDFIDKEVHRRYDSLVQVSQDIYRIPVQHLAAEHPVLQKGMIMLILEKLAGNRKDLETKHIEAVLSLIEKQVGRYVQLPYGVIAEKEYEHIKLFCKVSSKSEDEFVLIPEQVKVPGRTYISQIHKFIETELINYKINMMIPKNSCMKWFNYDKIENAVEIRTRREGDYIQINSNGGTKKLKDYFIDHKIPRKQRDGQLLITDGSHVMWIVGEGERMSERYKVEESTKRVLLIRLIDLEDGADDK